MVKKLGKVTTYSWVDIWGFASENEACPYRKIVITNSIRAIDETIVLSERKNQ